MVKLNAKWVTQETEKKNKTDNSAFSHIFAKQNMQQPQLELSGYRKLLYQGSTEAQIKSPKHVSKVDYKKKM